MRQLRFLSLVLAFTVAAGAGAARAEAPTSTSTARADDVSAKIEAANRALDAWQLDDAVAIASALEAALPDVPPVQALVGRVKFHQGDFAGAVRLLERAAEGGVDPDLLALARSTLAETKGSVSKESAHFVVRTPPGKDEVLADIALDALEKAYDAVSRAFDYRPEHKIAVDVLHDARGLASVSSLTVDEIETSGTIALCKYNRLMVTSPKALARGYSWLDTLAHELIHLVVSEKSNNEVPIWLHEGLAKYSESLWRGAPGLALMPPSENLLADAVKTNKLITFEQMHPSMAKLPSQEATALAFAEVFTVIEFLHRKEAEKLGANDVVAGFGATNRLLKALSEGRDMDDALTASVGMNLGTMQKQWKRYLKEREFKITPGAKPEKLTFVKNARSRSRSVDEDEDEAALGETENKVAKRFVRLGNLLRRRGRMNAASIEYEKAVKAFDTPAPALNNRLAGIYIELGKLDEAKTILGATVDAFPDDPQTRVLLGRVAFIGDDLKTARREYERATWENPFNPEIHAALYRIAEKTSDAALKTRAERALTLLTADAHAHDPRQMSLKTTELKSFGTLSLRTMPWGEVIIDGMSTGSSTPMSDYRLPPGRHRVRIKDPITGKQASQEIEIREGESARLDITLQTVSEDEVKAWVEAEDALRTPKSLEQKAPEPRAREQDADEDATAE